MEEGKALRSDSKCPDTDEDKEDDLSAALVFETLLDDFGTKPVQKKRQETG